MMLKDSELGKDLWGEAMATHVYIHNRCPSSVLPNGITPYERVFGHPPSVQHLHVFGSKCFIKIPDETRAKFDDKAKECQLISFKGDSTYMVINANQKRLRSHNIIFVEGIGNHSEKGNAPLLEFPMQESAHIEEVADTETPDSKKRQTRSEVWEMTPLDNPSDSPHWAPVPVTRS